MSLFQGRYTLNAIRERLRYSAEFDESKVKRDESGQFAEKEGIASEPAKETKKDKLTIEEWNKTRQRRAKAGGEVASRPLA